MCMIAPDRPAAKAVARPMPLAPPVTAQTRPSKRKSLEGSKVASGLEVSMAIGPGVVQRVRIGPRHAVHVKSGGPALSPCPDAAKTCPRMGLGRQFPEFRICNERRYGICGS